MTAECAELWTGWDSALDLGGIFPILGGPKLWAAETLRAPICDPALFRLGILASNSRFAATTGGDCILKILKTERPS
jgi:hypothetical protein